MKPSKKSFSKMDRLLWACLALLMFCYVQSFTIRDYLRQRELRPLSDERMRDSSSYAREPTLRELLEQDVRDFRRPSDLKARLEQDLNELSETQLRALLDEGKVNKEECKDLGDCSLIPYAAPQMCTEKDNPRLEQYIAKYCRRTCKHCEGPEKPPIAPIVECKDEDLEHCKNLKMLCDYEDKENRYRLSIAYTKKYCRKTCSSCG